MTIAKGFAMQFVNKMAKNSKTANFNKLAGNGLKMNFDEKKFFGAQAKMTFWDLASKLTSLLQRLSPRGHFGLGSKIFLFILSIFQVFLSTFWKNCFVIILLFC